MEKKEKRVYNASAVCVIILMLGTLMSLAGTVSTGGFSLFAFICIMAFLAFGYLAVTLFMKKKDMNLGISLCINALVSLVTLCFFFTWQELFICITLVLLALNYFVRDNLTGKKKYFLLALSLSASCIIIFTVTAFIRNANQAENGKTAFDMAKWAYYFSPFMFAVFHAALFDMLGLIINDSDNLKDENRLNRISFLPALIFIVSTVITVVIAVIGTEIGNKVTSVPETMLTVSSMAAYVASAVFPFFYSFLRPLGKTEKTRNTK